MFAKILKSVFSEVMFWIKYFLRILPFFMKILCPMFSIWVWEYLIKTKHFDFITAYVAVGLEVILVFCIATLISECFKQIHNNYNSIPIPSKRFTQSSEDNTDVYVDNARLSEMILYVNDVEDYLERKGLLKP